MLVRQSVEDAITPQHDEVMEVRPQCKLRDFWLCDNNTLFTPVLGLFSFDIAKCA